MTCLFKNRNRRRSRENALEREKIARLEQAEQELAALQERGDRAVGALSARRDRNHFAESIRITIIRSGTT